MNQRTYTPYELNHLRKHGFSQPPTSIKEKPVEYITGHVEFRGLDFLVNSSVLIPRLESEKLVQLALEHIHTQVLEHPAVADIGTGSGCLGLSLAFSLQKKQIPYTLYLSDISPLALRTAQKNAERLLASPVNLFFQESDLLDNYPHIKFDIILANLPYIPSDNIPTLPSSVKDYEPLSALDGGQDGAVFIDRLLKQIPHFLSAKGVALLEIDDTQTLETFSLPQTLRASLENDLFGVPRFLLVSLKL